MSIILQTDGTLGARTKFYEQGGEFPRKQIGSTVHGQLTLDFLGGDRFKIAFKDPKVIPASDGGGEWRGLKEFFGGRSAPPAIDFEFSSEELRSGRKHVRYWIDDTYQIPFLEFFDLGTHKGCWYRFPNRAAADQWASAIGVHTVEFLDEDGGVLRKQQM